MASNSYKLIFVYGTLKTGERNYHYFSTGVQPGEHVKLLAKCRLKEKYPLVVCEDTPCLLNKPGLGKVVVGELYEVDDAILSKLDMLEGHPIYYTRTDTVVVNLEDESEINCDVYFKSDPESFFAFPHISDYAQLVKKPD